MNRFQLLITSKNVNITQRIFIFDRMVRGMDTDSKHKGKKIGFKELHGDMFANKEQLKIIAIE